MADSAGGGAGGGGAGGAGTGGAGTGGAGGTADAGSPDSAVDVPACVPSCAGKSCGGDGCGGSCATCPAGKHCTVSFTCAMDFANDCGPGGGLDPMAPWPTTGRCYARRGAIGVLSVQKPVVAWTFPGSVASDIAIGRDGTLYFARSTTKLGDYALQAVHADGTPLWSLDGQLPSTAPTIGFDGTLYFTDTGGSNGYVWAINPAGTVRWVNNNYIGDVYSAVVVGADGTVFAGEGGGLLKALDPASGKVKFTRPSVFGNTTPAIGSDGTLYLAYLGVTAMTPDGTQRWQTPLGDGETNYVGVTLGPNNAVYVPFAITFGGGVHALDGVTGAVRWTVSLPYAVLQLPAVAGDGTIYVPTELEVDAVDKDGKVLWAFPTADYVGGVAVGGDGTIYVTSADENLYALNRDGSLKWILPVGVAKTSPVIGADGTIYVGTLQGLVAIGCEGGTCRACVPDCAGKHCGPDGCGGLCGACGAGQRCELSTRSCQSTVPPGGAGGCGDTRGLQAGAPWPALGRCPTRIGRSDLPGPHTTPSIHWSYTTGGAIVRPPAIAADGTLYVGSADKNLYAINPNGTLRWKFVEADSVSGTPAIGADGTIYTGGDSGDGRIYAVRPDGSKRWSLHFPFGTNSAPMVAGDGTIYAETRGYLNLPRLVTIDPLTGAMRWATKGDSILFGGPLLGPDGTTYVYEKQIFALAADGTLRWNQASAEFLPLNNAVVDQDGNVYVGGYTSLTKLGPGGNTLWTYQAPTVNSTMPLRAAPAIGADGSILVPIDGEAPALVALDPATGKVRWDSLVGSDIRTSPIVDSAGWIYYVATDNKLYVLDGNRQNPWSLQLPTTINRAPALGTNGMLYLSGSDGKLYAVGP